MNIWECGTKLFVYCTKTRDLPDHQITRSPNSNIMPKLASTKELPVYVRDCSLQAHPKFCLWLPQTSTRFIIFWCTSVCGIHVTQQFHLFYPMLLHTGAGAIQALPNGSCMMTVPAWSYVPWICQLKKGQDYTYLFTVLHLDNSGSSTVPTRLHTRHPLTLPLLSWSDSGKCFKHYVCVKHMWKISPLE